MTKLFFGGFPLDTNELQIVQLVSLHGDVETIKIVRDKQTKKCKGYAFLEMKDRAGADAAIEALDGAMMGERVLSVGIAPDKPAAPPQRRPSSGGYSKSPRPSGNYNSYGQGQNRSYSQGEGQNRDSGYSQRGDSQGQNRSYPQQGGSQDQNRDFSQGDSQRPRRPRK